MKIESAIIRKLAKRYKVTPRGFRKIVRAIEWNDILDDYDLKLIKAIVFEERFPYLSAPQQKRLDRIMKMYNECKQTLVVKPVTKKGKKMETQKEPRAHISDVIGHDLDLSIKKMVDDGYGRLHIAKTLSPVFEPRDVRITVSYVRTRVGLRHPKWPKNGIEIGQDPRKQRTQVAGIPETPAPVKAAPEKVVAAPTPSPAPAHQLPLTPQPERLSAADANTLLSLVIGSDLPGAQRQALHAKIVNLTQHG